MEQSNSSEAIQGVPYLFWSTLFYYRVHKSSLPKDKVLRQTNAVYTLMSFFKTVYIIFNTGGGGEVQ
jgi:hypothetical protein